MRWLARRISTAAPRGVCVALVLCAGSTASAATVTINVVPLPLLNHLWLTEFKVTGQFTSIGGAAAYAQNQKYTVTAVLANRSTEENSNARTYVNISLRIVPKSTCTQFYADDAYTRKIARFDPFVPSLMPGQTHPRFTFYMIFTCASSAMSAQLFDIGAYADERPRIGHWTTLDGDGIRH